MMSHLDNKILNSVDRALFLAQEISDLLSFDIKNNELYKKILQCRLEVQYVLAILCIHFDLECQPPTVQRKPEIDRDLIQISNHLSKCKKILSSGISKEAVADLLVADTLLGQLIILMRREKRGHQEKQK